MLTKDQYELYRKKALDLYQKASIVLTETEKQQVEIADFGLGQFEKTGLAVVVYLNTERCCARPVPNTAIPP